MATEEESTTLVHHPNEVDPFLVHLNVYDVIAGDVNPFLCWLGLGFNLSCVKVHGQEYIFRAGDADVVDEDHQGGVVLFRAGEGLRLRSSILMGRTGFDQGRCLQTIQQLRNEYTAASYNLFTNNFHHFSDHLCRQLTGGNPIPWWVNHVDKIGTVCKCTIPVDELNAEIRRNPLLSVPADDDALGPNFKVYLNVYIANPLLRCFGLPGYRSTVQVHAREYAFRPLPKDGSSNDYIISAPKGQLGWCRGLRLRGFILIGLTQMDPEQVSARVTQLQNEHNLTSYHHLKKNCHHFSEIVCRELTGNGIQDG